ncbi:VOC family protein [Microlunatus sp. GCM10028923]|uniref:VOC family protein n=1 Tax=Microlunatus sp. GCM10028923 TaxID=3273400 RepID=UPI00361E9A31
MSTEHESTGPEPKTAAPASVAMFTIDCADPAPLVDFYTKLLGMTVAYQDENVAMITGDGGPAIGFGKVDHYTPPPWPDDDSAKQFHLDLKVDDIEAVAKQAVELGATQPEHQPGETWRVLLDPAGHPFCLALWQN